MPPPSQRSYREIFCLFHFVFIRPQFAFGGGSWAKHISLTHQLGGGGLENKKKKWGQEVASSEFPFALAGKSLSSNTEQQAEEKRKSALLFQALWHSEPSWNTANNTRTRTHARAHTCTHKCAKNWRKLLWEKISKNFTEFFFWQVRPHF